MAALPPLPADLARGWVAREPTATDAPATYRLVADCDTAVLGHPDVALGDVEADLALDPHWQTVVVDPADAGATGEVVRAWAWLLDKAAGRVLADVYVDPGRPTDEGDRLAAWCWSVLLNRAAQLARQHDEATALIEVGSLDQDAATARRLAAVGFDRVRTFWRMRRDLGPEDASARPAAGVRIRSVREDEVRLVHELMEAAFVDHWGHQPRDYDSWWRSVSTRFGFDLDLWWLAEVDDQPAGLLIGTSQMADEGAIYVSTLGTLAAYRGRGVAKSLLRKAFAAGLERGWTEAQLGVDSDSPTSAPQLYLGLGFTESFAMHAWRLEVEAARP